MIARFFAAAAVLAACLASPAWAQADLTIEMHGRSDYLGGLTYAIGDPILISFDAINRGAAPAPGTNDAGAAGYMIDVIISTDATAPVRFATYSATFAEDALLLGGRMSRTDIVPAGGRVSFVGPTTMLGSPPRPYDYLSFTLPSGMRPGRYYICAQVDPGQRIAESLEINNTTCMEFTLRARLMIPRPRLPSPRQPGG